MARLRASPPHLQVGSFFLIFIIKVFPYRDAFIQFAGQDWGDVTGNNQTAGVFVTAPNVGISNLGGAIDQVRGA